MDLVCNVYSFFENVFVLNISCSFAFVYLNATSQHICVDICVQYTKCNISVHTRARACVCVCVCAFLCSVCELASVLVGVKCK